MKVSELHEALTRIVENEERYACKVDREVVIYIDSQSVGPVTYVSIKDFNLGFDWDTGKLFLIPDKSLVIKDV